MNEHIREENLEWLAGVVEEPRLEELAAVRSAVLSRLQARSRWRRWSPWAAIATATAVAVFLLTKDKPVSAPVSEPSIATLVTPPLPAPTLRIPPLIHRRQIPPRTPTVTLLTKADQPAWLKMETSDPNVVILWQLDENKKGDQP